MAARDCRSVRPWPTKGFYLAVGIVCGWLAGYATGESSVEPWIAKAEEHITAAAKQIEEAEAAKAEWQRLSAQLELMEGSH